jgi:hypothetical protein
MKIAGLALAIAEETHRLRTGQDRLPAPLQHPMGMTPDEFNAWFNRLPVQLTFNL